MAQTKAAGGKATEDALECPRCGCRHFEVSHTMGAKRRRVCRHCGRALMTREIPESLYRQLAAEPPGAEPVKENPPPAMLPVA